VTVGIREFRAKLSHYLDRARDGEVVTVTERGKPVVQVISHKRRSKLDELIAQGRARPALRPKRPFRADQLVKIDGPPWVTDQLLEDRGR
jgi:prevent-host-death family protein